MKMLVIDCETTTTEFHSKRFNGKPDGHIVEFGYTVVDLDDKKIVGGCHHFIFGDPNATGEEWVFKNTSLRHDSSRITAKEFDNSYLSIISGPLLCSAFNTDFDRTMIERDMPNLARCLYWLPDIMIAADGIEEIPRKIHDTSTGFVSYPSVQSTYDYLFPDKPVKEPHRAGPDSMMEAMILLELYKRDLWKPYWGVANDL